MGRKGKGEIGRKSRGKERREGGKENRRGTRNLAVEQSKIIRSGQVIRVNVA